MSNEENQLFQDFSRDFSLFQDFSRKKRVSRTFPETLKIQGFFQFCANHDCRYNVILKIVTLYCFIGTFGKEFYVMYLCL